MNNLYGSQHRTLQKVFDTEKLADAVACNILVGELWPQQKRVFEIPGIFFMYKK